MDDRGPSSDSPGERPGDGTRWARWPFVLAVVCVLILSTVAVRQYLGYAAAAAQVEHAEGVQLATERVLTRLLTAQSAYRGFLLTGRSQFLEPFTNVRPEVRELLTQVDRLADNPERQQSARQLRALADRDMDEMAAVLALHRGGQTAEARARVGSGRGQRLITEIQAVARTIHDAESARLVDLSRQATLERRGAIAFSIAGIVIAVALGLVVVSLQRNLERQRRAQAEELEERLRAKQQAEEERTYLLASERAARSQAERAARMKDEFVSTLSHELRTPLNAILGWIGILKQDRSPQTLVKAVDVIDRNSRRQSQIIDDLLDISRIIAGKLRLDVQRVDLAPVIEEALASARPAADAKGVRLVRVLGSSAFVHGDAGRLQQIVWNLVSNAIKFTPHGGTVEITLRHTDSEAQIQVRDTGQGIAADVLPYVFERFRQGDTSTTKRTGGLGLGLAIVKNLVEMHGGSVAVTSPGEGFGCVFDVQLPLAVAGTLAEGVPRAPGETPVLPSLLTGVHALVLDDDPDARELVERLLHDAGAEVTTARSGPEALTRLEEGLVPDIILSDIGMPDQDGYEFLQHVRQMSGHVAHAPAAALTALARVEDRRRALMAGYQTHLAKPVDPSELVAMVASLTGRTGGPAG